ncbi:MAG TPA: GNAT family N-acetyltransferase [Fimbriimonadaceae bacterium]|nr:GNAT family N-acetyltransferase [Fimbriimonadaceae bacterium]
MVTIRTVPHGSGEYWETVVLRDRILRQPLGLALSRDELLAEHGDLHLAAFEGERLVGCLVLTPLPDGRIKMRQVAVDPASQRSGVGTELVRESERLALAKGYRVMVLHARVEAVPFYLRLGYETVGEEFEEVTLPHFEMRKGIVPDHI